MVDIYPGYQEPSRETAQPLDDIADRAVADMRTAVSPLGFAADDDQLIGPTVLLQTVINKMVREHGMEQAILLLAGGVASLAMRVDQPELVVGATFAVSGKIIGGLLGASTPSGSKAN